MSHGYVMARVDGRWCRVHRIIWKMLHGAEPPEIDHRNDNKADNRRKNLRAATKKQNMAARSRKRASGLPRGVERHGRMYRARITHNGKLIRLGSFPSATKAHAAFCKAAQKYHGNFARFD